MLAAQTWTITQWQSDFSYNCAVDDGTYDLGQKKPRRTNSTSWLVANKIVPNTHNRLMALCPGLPGWAGTRRNIHPFTPMREKKKDLHRQQGPLRVSSSSLWCLLRGSLDPIKPAYNQSQPDGRAQINSQYLWPTMDQYAGNVKAFKEIPSTASNSPASFYYDPSTDCWWWGCCQAGCLMPGPSP